MHDMQGSNCAVDPLKMLNKLRLHLVDPPAPLISCSLPFPERIPRALGKAWEAPGQHIDSKGCAGDCEAERPTQSAGRTLRTCRRCRSTVLGCRIFR